MPHVKAASPADYGKAATLLETIRQERPDHWPHGLSPDMFEPGDLFLIRKHATADPVGFVGWQERQLGRQNVGLYSIGVLPAYRHQGIAKEAVSLLLRERAPGVDRVAALVAPGNMPSVKLAEALGVPLLKSAGAKGDAIKWVMSRFGVPAAGALGTSGFMDFAMAPGKKEGELPFTGEWSDKRIANTALNALIGAGAGHGFRTGLAKIKDPLTRAEGALTAGGSYAALMGAPVKDLVLYGPEAMHGIKELPAAVRELGSKITNSSGGGSNATAAPAAGGGTDWKTMGAAALIASALGGGAYALQRAMQKPQPQTGRMRVTLPTKNPGDAETSIDLPFDQSQALSNNLKSRLELDTRRRLYAETQERIRRRKGQPSPAFPNLESKVPQLS